MAFLVITSYKFFTSIFNYIIAYDMADITNKKVQEYKESLKSKAEKLILEGFPETIVELNNILETPPFLNREFADIHQDLKIPIPDSIVINSHIYLPPVKKTKFNNSFSQDGTNVALPYSAVTSNKNLLELVEIVKPHIRKLAQDSNLLKMWISFMIPKIEGGNNFGVSIQEDTLAEVQLAQLAATAYYDRITRYFIARGKLIAKVSKYPNVDDYRRAVQELDDNEHFSLWLVLVEIRNRYCSLHDVVVKNIKNIKIPRPNNATEAFY